MWTRNDIAACGVSRYAETASIIYITQSIQHKLHNETLYSTLIQHKEYINDLTLDNDNVSKCNISASSTASKIDALQNW